MLVLVLALVLVLVQVQVQVLVIVLVLVLVVVRRQDCQKKEQRMARQEDTLFPSHEPSDLVDIRIKKGGQMQLGNPSKRSLRADARICSIPCTP